MRWFALLLCLASLPAIAGYADIYGNTSVRSPATGDYFTDGGLAPGPQTRPRVDSDRAMPIDPLGRPPQNQTYTSSDIFKGNEKPLENPLQPPFGKIRPTAPVPQQKLFRGNP